MSISDDRKIAELRRAHRSKFIGRPESDDPDMQLLREHRRVHHNNVAADELMVKKVVPKGALIRQREITHFSGEEDV